MSAVFEQLVEEWLDMILRLVADEPDDAVVPAGWVVHAMAAARHFPSPHCPLEWTTTAGHLRSQVRLGKRRLADGECGGFPA